MNQFVSKFVNLNEWWATFATNPTASGSRTVPNMSPDSRLNNMTDQANQPDGSRSLLWIDGVGTYLVCTGDQVSIGGPTAEQRAADISLLANLSRIHATICRRGDGYFIEAHSPTKVSGRDVIERTDLNDGYEIGLSDTVRLRFRLPSVLSASARLEFLSVHRPGLSVDGIVLMGDTCLLGPGETNHILCHDWPDAVLLFRRDGQLWCKSRMDLFLGDRHIQDGSPIENGDIITGPELRFRFEAI